MQNQKQGKSSSGFSDSAKKKKAVVAGDGKEADKAVSAIDAALAADEARKTAERDERERQETIDRYRQKNKPKEQESCCFGRCCGR